MIEIIRSGPLTTVQDFGRPGYAHLGVPRSGALDRPAMVAANRAVGNPDDAAVLEITLGGLTARFPDGALVAVAGAQVPVRVNGEPVHTTAGPVAVHTTAGPVAVDTAAGPVAVETAAGPVAVPAGGRLDLGQARSGLRCYLAVAGGIAVDPVLGSRATDTLSGLGPPVLRPGTRLRTGEPSPGGTQAPAVGSPGPAPGPVTLRLRYGPRAEWFTADSRDLLLREAYTVTMHSNRVGARLAGPALTRAVAGELPSEGIVLGAVQVPGDGQPLVFLADHPTTGGYPVIAVVEEADLPMLAQCRPGATVRFCGPQQ